MVTATNNISFAVETPVNSEASSTAVSKEEYHKLLAQMLLKLAEVLSDLSGTSVEEINLAVERGKTYESFLDMYQKNIEDILKQQIAKKEEITQNDSTQQALNIASMALGGLLIIVGFLSIFSVIGAGAAAPSLSIGIGLLATGIAQQWVIPEIEKAIDTAVDNDPKIPEAEKEEKKATFKLLSKIGVAILITATSCGAGTLAANAAAKSAQATTQAAAQVATQAATQASVQMTSSALSQSLSISATLLGSFAATGAVENIMTLCQNDDPVTGAVVNGVIMALCLVLMFAAVKTGKLVPIKAKTASAKTPAKADVKTAKADAKAQVKAEKEMLLPKDGQTHISSSRYSFTLGEKISAFFADMGQTLSSGLKNSANAQTFLNLLRQLAAAGLIAVNAAKGAISIEIGNLKFELSDLEIKSAGLTSSDAWVNNLIDSDSNLTQILEELIGKTAAILRSCSQNPKDFIADETEFVRIFSQAV
ncbi:MAG: hypothetical protein WC371_01475 [Parachlamydiales bacterium]|jgi:hypothetical protein